MKTLSCEVCGVTCERRGHTQKYCPSCSDLKDRERKLKWAKANPSEPSPLKVRRERDSKRKQLGVDLSTRNRTSITWTAGVEDNFTHSVRFAIPYDGRLSKNAVWNMAQGGRGHVYIRQEAKAIRDAITYQLMSHKEKWYEGKIWLDLFVEKPDARSDAINIIDSVADAVKKGIGIDDRWFCIRRLDWSIVKTEPRIYIGISQEVEEHHRVCSSCGTIKPITLFQKNKSNVRGVGRHCLECASILRPTEAQSKT